MRTSQAIILGIIQGLTEFIPVSSTAHLTLAGKLMGVVDLDSPEGCEEWTAFIAVIQMGTLLAVLTYFMPDVIHIAAGVVSTSRASLAGDDPAGAYRTWARLGWLLIAGSVPIGIAGLALRNRIEGTLTKNSWVIVAGLLAVAALLAVAESAGAKTREISDLGAVDACVVGISQVLALVPGASRSGATIATGLLTGLNRQAASRFSFLLMIPAVAASGLFKLPRAARSTNAGRSQVIAGILTAGFTGYLAISAMLGYLQTHTVYPFVAYRVMMAMLVSGLLVIRKPKAP
jgi:undecaprenyl-diphosphatase